MKRRDALDKVRVICRRLDKAGPDLPVVPLALYLFGSVLTNKPAPTDVDLLLECRGRAPQLQRSGYRVGRLLRHGSPAHEAGRQLRRGLRKVHLSVTHHGVAAWLKAELSFPEDLPRKLVWAPDLGWEAVIAGVEERPAPWDPDQEEFYDYLQRTTRKFRRKYGYGAAEDWARGQINRARRGTGHPVA